MNSQEHAAHMARFERLHKILVQAQEARKFMPMEATDVPYWNTYEMLTVWGAVNQIRHNLNKDTLPFDLIERVESMAAGHSDYTKKFALYSAELILED